ncbi:hypothetical protein LSH36_584g00016 [Paralvinella palmiformis]|uniref:EGF-like domain-containing protein n=1 Tax=Paralvinella palmiformis TaxID=53620 RepID=A0AAD9MWI6_9ANNE|nr:hypothetical protein LSH36_584g00016 [Paralvinella palmiformis]
MFLSSCGANVLCYNGATCIDTGNGWHTCSCPYGYAGARCDIAERVNFARHPKTTCIASSRISDDYRCEKTLDGSLQTLWVCNMRTVGQWLKVQFSGYIGVDEMKLWDRCHLRDQAKTAKLEFSDNSSFTVYGTCTGIQQSILCGYPISGIDFQPKPMPITEWIKLTVLQICGSDPNGNFGLHEVEIFGRFISK